MTLDGSDKMAAGFNVAKNINGLDLSFKANQSLAEDKNQEAMLSLSSKF